MALWYVIAWLSCCTKVICPRHKNPSSVSLGDCALENKFSIQEIESRSSFSGHLVLNHRPIFADQKVIDNLFTDQYRTRTADHGLKV